MAATITYHLDDIGMCHGANAAFFDLFRRGRLDCGSVMVPCPWFLEVAEECVRDPSLDMGVHLTLTAEKRYYRWRPLTRAGAASGLVDGDGFMWRSVPELRRAAVPDAAEAEMRAQLDTALAAGIDVTHIDGHMGAVLAPEFVDIYVRLGREYRLPILFPRSIYGYGPIHNFAGDVDDGVYARMGGALAAEGQLLCDRVLETPWHLDGTAESRYRPLMEEIGDGFTFFALHANLPGELESIEPDSARIRTAEYELLSGDTFAAWQAAAPGVRTGMRALRERLRAHG